MIVEIKLPDYFDIPPGATLEYREVKPGELYISNGSWDSGMMNIYVNGEGRDGYLSSKLPGDNCVRFVVTPPYEFPDCIPDGWWIAMDGSGYWWSYETEPTYDPSMRQWRSRGGAIYKISWLNIELPNAKSSPESKIQKLKK